MTGFSRSGSFQEVSLVSARSGVSSEAGLGKDRLQGSFRLWQDASHACRPEVPISLPAAGHGSLVSQGLLAAPSLLVARLHSSSPNVAAYLFRNSSRESC